MLQKRNRIIILNHLDRIAVDRRKTGTQGFMSIDKRLKALLKRRDIHDPGESHFNRNVVGRALRKEVVEKPEPLLCKRESKGVRTFHWDQRDSLAKSRGISQPIEKFMLVLPDFCEEIICHFTFGSAIAELVVLRP
jgi:hypothetical protein